MVVKKITEDAPRPVREFSRFDGSVLLGLDSLGLRGVAQRHVPRGGRGGVWEIRCEPVEPARLCRECGIPAPVRSSRWRRFVHTPLGKAGVHLLARCRRYECRTCGGAWEDDLSRVGAGGRRLTESAVWWAVASVVLDAMSIRSVAMTLGCSWDCANDAVLAKGLERLVDDEHRLDGVSVIGVDEHVWRHTPRGSRYVTVVVDLTPRSDGRPARLLDVVGGRSGAVFAGWLASRSEGFRRNVRVVAMDAFAGYKHAVRGVVPHAREVLDPFHVVRLAGDRLTRCRQRLQQEATGRRGTKHDPLYKARRILLKTRATLTDRQRSTLGRLFGDERNKPLEVMWGAYQKIIACYAEPDRRKARGMMHELVDSINARPANAPGELMTLARTLKRRLPDVLAYFDHEFSSNGPTEAVNGRLEHLRGIALGFTNLNNYITRSLLHAGGFRQTIQEQISQP